MDSETIESLNADAIIRLCKDRSFLLNACKLALRMMQGKQSFQGCSEAEGVLKGAIASVEEKI